MNTYFKTLADLLPPHQGGRKRNKVDILVQASKHIKDLHSRMEELFSTHATDAHKEELTRLKKLVTQLFTRMQLLSTLLREAGISVPAEPALEKMCPLKWSNKLNADETEQCPSKVEEIKAPENKREKSAELKVPSKRKSVAPSQPPAKKVVKSSSNLKKVNRSIENQENRANCANSKNDNSDAAGNASETGSKETECSQIDASPNAVVSGSQKNSKAKSALKKVDTQKKVKKKAKKKDGKKSATPSINNSVTNLTPNTLILSGAKLMPLVTPMAPNIIVNTQQQPANPIILSNTHQNQMIVMQPLTNRVQNPIVSICNRALINTVRRVTLNTVPSIRTNMVVHSRNWASNVKNIINASKIGGHKSILPKGKAVTKTTMTYKVPIPAVHKDKLDKSKEHANKKDVEVKSKVSKNQNKTAKNQQTADEAEEKNEKEKSVKDSEDANSQQKGLKRSSTEVEGNDEPAEKKRKTSENTENTIEVNSISELKVDPAVTCKSVETIKNVMAKTNDDVNEDQDKNNEIAQSNEKEATESIVENSTASDAADVDQDVPDSSKSIDVRSDTVVQCENKTSQTTVVDTIPSVAFSEEQSKSNDELASVSPETELNISVDGALKKSDCNTESSTAKASLTEVEEIVQESVESKKIEEVCNLGTELDNLLQVTPKEPEAVEATTNIESNKIILNLDTNTTTTLKQESTAATQTSDTATQSSSLLSVNVAEDETKLAKTSKDEVSKASLSYNTENTFVPISNRTDSLHSDLSNDIFASLQVPSSSHNPESISPTAAFLMAFPLVSSLNGKTEVLEEEMKEDFKYHSQTPPMLLQIGAMEPNSFKLKTSSPSHTIAEKRLKVTCEEGKNVNPPVSEPMNPEIIVPVECSSSSKALPKVINNEPLRESYKIVQSVLPSLEKSTSSNSFSHNTLYSIANVSGTTSISTTTETEENCQRQLTTSLQNTITNTNTENVIAPQVRTVSTSNKTNQTSCSVQVSTCDTSVRYSTSQDFLSSYSAVVDNNLPNLQQNATVCNSSAIQETNSTAVQQNVTPNVSQTSLVPQLTNTTTTTNTSSLPLQSMQIDYTPQMKEKESHSSRVGYGVHSKDSLVDTNVIPNNRLSYTGHVDRILPTSSQNMQQDYSIQSKDVSLPILSSQAMQPVYDSQPKDTHALAVQQSSHQAYTMHEKDRIVQSSHNDYSVDQNKTLPRKDNVSYSTGTGNTNTSTRNQNYPSKDPLPNSSENHFQRSYPKMNKDSDSSTTNILNQDGKLDDVLRTKPQEQSHRRDANYTSTKKMDIDPFAQTFSYGVKESMSTQAEQNVLNPSTENIFQEKRGDTQNYTYANKDMKKINTSSSNNMSSKSLIQNTSGSRYSQESTSFVATSNYEQSTVTENHAKSTTTVAHNSSNFSILSWTTFSPVGGSSNNNMVQFEPGPSQTDNAEAKTICESYSYVPLQKENQNFPNVLANDVYSTNSSVANIDKSRMKSEMDSQKTSFVDHTKVRNIQTNVPSSGKQSRMQSQGQTSSASNDYNKFSTENKNKSKYGMDSEYIQNEFSGMNQQSQQQHAPKNHQPIATKQDKAVYPISTYDSQVNFDLPEVTSQMKYSVETYASSNFKYPDKSQQQNQNKYQPLIQGQIPSLQHDSVAYNNDGKHGQQQSTTKSKGNQQQHAIRAPVNWMMTPEIKHNTNIADIILPPIGKELEFCQNNLFTQTPSYNQGTPNQFYNNYDVAAHSFPNLPVLQSDPKRTSEVFYSEEQPFPWSPTKTSVHIEQTQAVKGIDQHIVPSSLPTLVGDLDLGTNIPEKQNFLFGQVPSRIPTDQSKDPIKDKESNVGGRDFHTVLNNQTVQHPGAGPSFLSVSQLVEHEKAEKSHQQHHQQHHHHHHHHHAHQHPQQQQQQQQQQQNARKHQRKSNTSPRGNSKRQLDIRKQASSSDQLHQRHEEQKSSGHNFSDPSYQQQQQQQQKYQQNNVHWRSRNCKSNYTAEALIGTNNNVHDTNQDKHASIKFTTNYSQNKFQTSLPTADTVMPINYFSNTDDGSGYGQMVNQNFNSYTYSSNTNIYPTSNFITSISNTPTSYMMPLHDNTDYMEANTFLLPNVAASSTATSSSTSTVTTSTSNINTNTKNHQHYGKHQNCDKRTYSANTKKGKRKGIDGTMQNLEFPLSGINSPLEDYHHSTFLPPPPPPHASPLYQNHTQANVYTKAVNGLPPPPPVAGPQGVPTVAATGFPMNPNMPRGGIVSSNPMTMSHHPSGTSLTNFNLSTIFPEINDKVTGYKPSNGIPSGLSQPPNQSTAYVQRSNYPTNPLCHLPQVSEGSQFGNSVPPLPPPPPPGVIPYKNV